MRGFGFIPDDLLPAFDEAIAEDRLGWRVTDQHGRSCNSGQAEPLVIGEWSEEIDNLLICQRGWHLTTAPHRSRGVRVWLCEAWGGHGEQGDKKVWARIRPLAEVDPAKCIDVNAYVRCAPSLEGANLEGANLVGARLVGANLEGANLEGANLEGARLVGDFLRRGAIL